MPGGAAFDSNTGRLYYSKPGTVANTAVFNIYNNTGAVATNTNAATISGGEYHRMGVGQDGNVYGTKTALVIQLSASAPRIDIMTVKLTRYNPSTNTFTILGNIQCPAAYASTMPAPYNTGDYWSCSDATTTPFYAAQLGNAIYGDLAVSPDNSMYMTIGKKLIRIPNYSSISGTGLIPAVEVGNILPTGVGFNFTTQGSGTYGLSWDNNNNNLLVISSRTSDGSDGSYNVNPATGALTGSFRVNCLATPTSANFADLTDVMSSIGAANRLVSVQWLGYNNKYRLTYQIRVENIGTSILKNVQSALNLATVFPSLTINNVSANFVNNPASLVLNPAYNGTGNNSLLDGLKTLYSSRYNGANLNGGAGNITAGSNFAIIEVTLDVAGVATNGTTTYNCTATATGTGFDGTTVTDNSDNGLAVETGSPNLKADDAGEGDPTPIKFGSTVSGTVWNDANNSANGTLFNIFTAGESGTNAGGLNATLVDPVTNLVINSVPVAANGTYSFSNIASFANLQVVISTTAGVAGSAPPAASVPSGWQFTSPGSTNTTGDINTGVYNSADLVRFGAIDDPNNDFGIKVADTPVILTCPINTTVAACQSQAAINAAFATWLATASGSGGCSGMLTNNNTGAPDACGGSTTVTFTYSSTCAPFTTFCQASFTVSPTTTPTPSFANCGNTFNLGCNPGSLPTCTDIANGSFGGAVTASNSCGSVPVTCSAGSITINGCNRSQVFTFTATACGITSTCTRTYNWTSVTPPSFNGTCGNGVINLGCNPVTLPACDPNVMATNECGPISVTCNVGTIQVNGCNRQQTLIYVANAAGCGTFSTCQKIYNWQVTTAPVFANCDNTFDLGCNPATIPTCANVQTAPFGGAVTASNECGNVSGITCSEGAVTSSGCNRSKVFTFSVTACGFTSTCTRTFTWKVASLPVFDNCTTSLIDLGCNPSTLPGCDASVTATSECGLAMVVCTAGMITSSGCNKQQIFTYEATGECGASTCTRTYVWQESTPVILTCPVNTTVAACQTQIAIDAAFNAWLANASASGGCNGVLTNNNMGAPPACGGSTTVIFTYSSSCTPLTTTCQATFTVATAPPILLTCRAPTTVNGGQTQAAVNMQFATWLSTATASGGCNGMLTNNNVGAPLASGGTTSVTFTYTSSCAPLTTTCVSSFSVQQGNFVNTTTNTNYTTLQDAIDAANAMSPDTIELLDNMDETNVTITNSVVIRSNGFTLTIPSGMLSIPMGRSLTWFENNLVISPGAVIDNDGTLINKGTISYQAGMGSFTNTGYYGGTGSFLGNFVNNGTVNTGN